MRHAQLHRVAGAAAFVAALLVPNIGAEEPKDLPVAKPVAAEPVAERESEPAADPVPIREAISSLEVDSRPETKLSTEEILNPEEEPTVVNPAEADRNADGELSERELALQDHREQLKIYDLNGDKKISEEEWKAANKEDRERNDKFFLVDKDEDGEIDEEEAVGFLMERISVGSTYVDATGDENTNVIDNEIEENAPTEVRFTLFSIPFGD